MDDSSISSKYFLLLIYMLIFFSHPYYDVTGAVGQLQAVSGIKQGKH